VTHAYFIKISRDFTLQKKKKDFEKVLSERLKLT